ncbi:MAG TPA: DegV family protein [Anaerolineae bacterium]|nr:DegV family protein [Anaerolineae bacterium]
MVRIVTDSTADVPEEFVRELDIVVVPVHVIFGTRSYDDGVNLSREEFYARLITADPLPTSSSPSAGEFEVTYRRLRDEGADAVVSVHVAATLSAVQNAAHMGAQAVPDLEVAIVDSGQVSMGLGWQVIEAARAARAGQSIGEILDAVARVRQRVRLFAALDTLEYVRRSGRVGWARAAIGQLLKIKPIVEVRDGAVLSVDRVRTRAHCLARLKELVAGQGALRSLIVLHTRARNAAQALADEFRTLHSSLSDPIYVAEATTAIGTYVGPNGLGVACVVDERRK